MTKNNLHKKLFLIFVFFLAISASTCLAVEINPESYPKIPFTDPLTAESQLPHYIVYFFALGISLSGALALIFLTIGGIQLIFSSVSPEARSNAIDKIKGAILGLVLLTASVIIIQAINPNLKKIEHTVHLMPLGSLQLVGSGENAPAPGNLSVLDDVRKNYSAIAWPETTEIINPKTNEKEYVTNCDENNENAVYNVYLYANENYKNFKSLERLTCGGKNISFSGVNSYTIIRELPGVYFYDAPNCEPKKGSDSFSIPVHSTQSIPEWSGKRVMSMRIVNGPDNLKGPFWGVIFFDGPDYKTQESSIWARFQHFQFITNRPAANNYSNCIETSKQSIGLPAEISQGASFAIYKWAGFNEDKTPNINCSVDLYSRSSWTGGYSNIGVISEGYISQYWQKELKKIKVLYRQNTTISRKERDLCSEFTPKYNCLQSFEIKGNCLVLVSNIEDSPSTSSSYTSSIRGKAQRFPISPRIVWSYENRKEGYSIERGTPELASDYITSANSYFIKIIPLAEKINN